MQIPGGLVFYQPQTKWRAKPNSSLNQIADALIRHRLGNPHLVNKYHWATDFPTVYHEVEQFNVRVCEAHGWTDYLMSVGGPPDPKPFPPQKSLFQSVKQVAAGASVLVEWISSGAESVASEVSNKRASICVTCPKNEKGDWTAFFTKPVSAAIQNALNQRSQFGLSTFHDENLGICSACSCPLKLKVHLPLDKILSKLPPESKAALDANCWILSEK